MEVQLTEQKGERGPHVVGFLDLHFFGAVVGGGVEPEELAVGDEQFAFGLGVIPAHAAGLAQQEHAAFRARRRLPGARILLS